MSRDTILKEQSGTEPRTAAVPFLFATAWRHVLTVWILAVCLSGALDLSMTAYLDRENIGLAFLRMAIIPALVAIPLALRSRRAFADQLHTADVLRDLVRRDQQTGLLHHNAFIEDAGAALRQSEARVLLIGDIDRFKTINDSCGHMIGDAVILAVGDVVRDLFDRTSITGRIGGEEFAVLMLMPFADRVAAHHAAIAFAQEWRKRIEKLRVEGVPYPISISIGVARSDTGESFDSLYARADRALYVAKTSGRNRVCSDEHEPGPLDEPWPADTATEVTWIEDPAAEAKAPAEAPATEPSERASATRH
jgi:diguanylate cyclase (GGDEF)-like protein